MNGNIAQIARRPSWVVRRYQFPDPSWAVSQKHPLPPSHHMFVKARDWHPRHFNNTQISTFFTNEIKGTDAEHLCVFGGTVRNKEFILILRNFFNAHSLFSMQTKWVSIEGAHIPTPYNVQMVKTCEMYILQLQKSKVHGYLHKFLCLLSLLSAVSRVFKIVKLYSRGTTEPAIRVPRFFLLIPVHNFGCKD